MKKIGILYGQENTFPQAFVDRVNSKNIKGVEAELLTVDEVIQARPTQYAVIFDRISQDVPFYRAYLKNAALCGTTIINNPFWWSADEKFFNNCLAESIGVPVPKTVLLPTKERPADTSADSFRNLKFPMDWDAVFDYIGGFPAYMKPHAGGGWKNVYKLHNQEEFFAAYSETNTLVMMLQEEIKFDAYFRCYCIGRKHVRVMPYEPRNPHHLRYVADFDVSDELMQTVHDYVLKLNEALGYDFNTVEFAIQDGVPYAIDFCNPAPDADVHSVGEENFEWVVEHAALYAIEKALENKEGQTNIHWGSFITNSVNENSGSASSAKPAKKAPKKATKKAPAKKAAAPKKAKTAKQDAGTDVEGSKSDLLSTIGKAKKGQKDDLKQIKGIGPKLEKMLNEIGITSYSQVSKMTKKEYDLVDGILNAFKGRGERDDWSGQAKELLG